MDRRQFLSSAAVGALGSMAQHNPAAAQEKKKDKAIDAAVERGLEALKKQQGQDGHWESPGGFYPTCITGVAGMGS